MGLAALSCVLVLGAWSEPASAASHTDLRICTADQDVPEAVAVGLDRALISITDGNASSVAALGYAPGAEIFVRAADWTYHRSLGTADLTANTPLDCGRPFQIGSNTKMMTATVLMQLVEEGLLALDDPLSEHLPDIAEALPFGESMTLRQLANHTSGVFSYTDNAPNGAPGIMEGALTDQALLGKTYTPAELIRFVIDNGAPNFEPGAEAQWSYSNTGFILIGMILEQATGMPLEELYRDRIFTPLGMSDSFLWNGAPRAEFDLPSSYYEPPFDIDTTTWNMSQAWAAGGVISTSSDMDLFVRGLFGGQLFDDPATLPRMLDGVPTDGSFLQYGIGVGEKIGGSWGHGGQTLGFESDVGMIREMDISMIVWANSARNLAGLGTTLVFGVLGEAGALNAGSNPPDGSAEALSETRWTWVSSSDGGDGTLTVNEPDRYAIMFRNGNDLALKADCNRVMGSYQAQGDTLSLTLGASTKAMCPPDTLDDRFLAELQETTGFRRDGDTLVLFLGQDGQMMEFIRDAQ